MMHEQQADPYRMLDPGLHTELSTPEVWAASLRMQPNKYPVLSDPLVFHVARKGYSDLQESTMRAEAKFLNLDPSTDETAFVAAHQDLIRNYSANLRAELPRAKNELIDSLIQHLGDRKLSDGASLSETIEQRLSQITEERLVVDDVLRGGAEARASDSLGAYYANTRTISAGILEWLACEELYPGRGMDKFVNLTLKHELFHALFASATVFDENGPYYSGVRNGLRLSLPISKHKQGIRGAYHARWLNEATIESTRRKVTGERSASYLSEVLLLETLEELSPGLRDELVIAAIDPEGPSATLAKVEMLLGPTGTGIEDADVEFSSLPIGSLRHSWLAARVMRCFHQAMRSGAQDAYAKAEAKWMDLPEGSYTSKDFDALVKTIPLGEMDFGLSA